MRPILLVWLIALLALPVRAQDGATLPEEQFWARLEQTRPLLEAGQSAEARWLWEGVTAVELPDGSRVPLDLDWLRLSDTAAPEDIAGTIARAEALLAWHAGRVEPRTDALQALEEVLNDPLFQYDSSAELPEIRLPVLPSVVAQALLIGGALVALGLLLAWLVRRIGSASARADTPPEYGDDPTTRTDAEALAMQAEAAGDLRLALRYWTLACLLLLDERGLLRYDPALTNREHLRQLGDAQAVTQQLRPVLALFDQVWYGFVSVDAALYGEFRARVDALHALVQPSAGKVPA